MKLNFPEILEPIACSFFYSLLTALYVCPLFLQSLFEQVARFQRSEGKEKLSKCSSVQYVVLVSAI